MYPLRLEQMTVFDVAPEDVVDIAAHFGIPLVSFCAVDAVARAPPTDFNAFLVDDEAIVSWLRIMMAMGEIGKVIDITSVIAALASSVAGWITGERIRASDRMHP